MRKKLIDRMRESAEAIKYNAVYPKRNMDSKRERDGEGEMMREREIESDRERRRKLEKR